MSYLTTPRQGGHATSRAAVAAIMQAASSTSLPRATRFWIDGDSQETSPGGQGNEFINLLNWRFWEHFGTSPESQLHNVSSSGSGAPFAPFGQRAASYDAVAAGSTPTARYPYSFQPAVNNRYTAGGPGGSNNNNGIAAVLQANLLNIPSSLTEIRRDLEYIKREGITYNALVPKLSNQGDSFYVRFTSSATGAPAFFNSNQGSAVIDISAAISAANEWLQVSAPYQYGATPPTPANLATLYPQAVARSNNSSQVEIGAFWWSSTDKRGIVVHACAEGGKRTDQLFSERPDCAPFIAAFAPDVVVFACGTNDVIAGHSAATFKTNVLAKISAYRAAIPGIPVILLGDADCVGFSAPARAEFDNYPDKLQEIADDPANLAVYVNRRRILEEHYGWVYTNPNFSTLFAPDGYHYNTSGARMAAYVTYDALLELGQIKRSGGPSSIAIGLGLGFTGTGSIGSMGGGGA